MVHSKHCSASDVVATTILAVSFVAELSAPDEAAPIVAFVVSPLLIVFYAIDKQSAIHGAVVGFLSQLVPLVGYMLSDQGWNPRDTSALVAVVAAATTLGVAVAHVAQHTIPHRAGFATRLSRIVYRCVYRPAAVAAIRGVMSAGKAAQSHARELKQEAMSQQRSSKGPEVNNERKTEQEPEGET